MFKSYSMELAGRTLTVDIGRVAAQANGAAFMHYGDTTDEDFALIPNDITLNAQGVQYDSMKPCFWQTLNYQCDTDVD